MTYRVYADVILLQNLAADFLLLSVVKNCLRLPERRYGRLAGSLLGAVYAGSSRHVPAEDPYTLPG